LQAYRALIRAAGGKMGTAKVLEMLRLLGPHEKNNHVYTAALTACEDSKDWAMALR
jgi:hypothetical protein